jgi:hypothetical protein
MRAEVFMCRGNFVEAEAPSFVGYKQVNFRLKFTICVSIKLQMSNFNSFVGGTFAVAHCQGTKLTWNILTLLLPSSKLNNATSSGVLVFHSNACVFASSASALHHDITTAWSRLRINPELEVNTWWQINLLGAADIHFWIRLWESNSLPNLSCGLPITP